MLPLKDLNPTRSRPYVTWVLIALNTVVFLFQLGLDSMGELNAFLYTYGLVPAEFNANPLSGEMMTILTSMFLHGGILHLLGNMLYLWIFGDNVEDSMGRVKYFSFYLVGGVVASATHILTNPNSELPTVGASGAIAAVLGAYLVLYPHSRVLTIIPLGYFMRMTWISATIVLGLWFVLQLFSGLFSLGGPDVGGVAFWAHAGGFVAGVVMAKLFASSRKPEYAVRWDR